MRPHSLLLPPSHVHSATGIALAPGRTSSVVMGVDNAPRLQPGTSTAMPQPRQLAALGAVLCLYRGSGAGELEGWSQAMSAACARTLDSDGLHESLQFFDAEGRCCWRLHLLPDTDFWAWEQAVAGLPERVASDPALGVGERLWRRVARRMNGPAWRARVLRLHVVSGGPGGTGWPLLAASLPSLSACGEEVAARILRREGVADEARFDHLHGREAATGKRISEGYPRSGARLCA